jgi:hypothetical protein
MLGFGNKLVGGLFIERLLTPFLAVHPDHHRSQGGMQCRPPRRQIAISEGYQRDRLTYWSQTG